MEPITRFTYIAMSRNTEFCDTINTFLIQSALRNRSSLGTVRLRQPDAVNHEPYWKFTYTISVTMRIQHATFYYPIFGNMHIIEIINAIHSEDTIIQRQYLNRPMGCTFA